MSLLALRQLTLRAGERTLVEGLDLTLHAGEDWAVLGPNGSGKSTLLHTLGGLQMPAAGEVRLDDVPLDTLSLRERAHRMGVLFQEDDHAFPSTVLEIALSGRYPHGPRSWLARDREEDLSQAREALRAVDLTGFESRQVSSLSGGERRRLQIAAVLAQDTQIRLLDEPTNHLDLRHQSAILDRLVSAKRGAVLNLFVLHDPNLAARYCSHALLLPGDGTSLHGPIAEVLTTKSLQGVYGCRITELRQGGRTFYVTD